MDFKKKFDLEEQKGKCWNIAQKIYGVHEERKLYDSMRGSRKNFQEGGPTVIWVCPVEGVWGIFLSIL